MTIVPDAVLLLPLPTVEKKYPVNQMQVIMSKKGKNISLFSPFSPVSREQWEEVIEKDLKGAPRDRKVVWHTPEGLSFEPYYRQDDLEKIKHADSLPGEFPYVRGNKRNSNDWEVRQEIEETAPEAANAEALNALKKGAEAVVFNVSRIDSSQQMALLLKGIDPENTPVHFTGSSNYGKTLDLLLSTWSSQGTDFQKVLGSFDYDPVGYFILNGSFYDSWEANIGETVDLLNRMIRELPGFRLININGRFFHNAGGTIVQDLGYSMAAASEYLAALTDTGIQAQEIISRMQFSFAVGSSYFMEIARIRAARMLWANLASHYSDSPEAGKTHIHVENSLWNKTLYDPYVNMLRNTTEAMAGAIAGCNSMSVRPFDHFFRSPGPMSKRVARNTQIILKEEAHLNKTVDPAAGSYYVEKLTQSIASASWDLFRETEAAGGFIKAFEQGTVKKAIEETCTSRDEAIAKRKTGFIGTNQFPNPEEYMLKEIQKELTFKDNKTGSGLTIYRGAENFEKLRLGTEKHVEKGNKKPGVYLLKMGNRAMRTARASFSSAFFGCAGYDIFDNLGFDDNTQAVDDALSSNAEIIIICSSDEDYPALVPDLTKAIKAKEPNKIIIVAGYPKAHVDAFKERGVDDFIHIKTPLLKTLQGYHNALEINY